MFRALLVHPQEALNKPFNPGAAHGHNTHAIYQILYVYSLLRMSK
jgi:hypothetical protein